MSADKKQNSHAASADEVAAKEKSASCLAYISAQHNAARSCRPRPPAPSAKASLSLGFRNILSHFCEVEKNGAVLPSQQLLLWEATPSSPGDARSNTVTPTRKV